MKIAVTGHRPHKLGRAYDTMHPINIEIGRKMRDFILNQTGYNKENNRFADNELCTIISGMALGVDTVWALVALKLSRQFPDKFILECAVPCKEQDSKWLSESKKTFHRILSEAHRVVYVTDTTYTHTCMQERNEYMVNEADMVLAVWDGTGGGTGNCVQYAREQNKELSIIDPKPIVLKFQK